MPLLHVRPELNGTGLQHLPASPVVIGITIDVIKRPFIGTSAAVRRDARGTRARHPRGAMMMPSLIRAGDHARAGMWSVSTGARGPAWCGELLHS